MVVEDDDDILKIVKLYLKKWGFDVDAFSDPVQALAHFQKNHDDYAVVLTDVRMPNMTGIELAQLMKMLKPGIKVVFMTAFEITQTEQENSSATIRHEEILKKPFRLVEVCSAVKKQLQMT